MESIILFALIAVVSSVFQLVTKQAKQPQKAKQSQFSNQNRIYETMPEEILINPIEVFDEGAMGEKSFRGSMLNNSSEGIQTEALSDDLKTELQSTLSYNDYNQSINLGDIQKSVIMAEILGKPRAVKRNIR